jgi:DNA-binding transcriptional MerR regulator
MISENKHVNSRQKKIQKSLDKQFQVQYNSHMAYENSQKHFRAKDIERLLNINKDQLYHWVKLKRLIKPEIEEGFGRGGRNKFSFKNLLDLSLIKDLYELRFDFYQITQIMKTTAPLFDPITGGPEVDWDQMKKVETDIWESFSSNRPEFEEEGYVLIIARGKNEDRIFVTNEKKFYKMLYEKSPKRTDQIEAINKPLIIIDLLEKIRVLEQKTGHKLDYYAAMIKAHRESQGVT